MSNEGVSVSTRGRVARVLLQRVVAYACLVLGSMVLWDGVQARDGLTILMGVGLQALTIIMLVMATGRRRR